MRQPESAWTMAGNPAPNRRCNFHVHCHLALQVAKTLPVESGYSLQFSGAIDEEVPCQRAR